MISASAPGKIILFGEHAVVYGRPALAVPVTQLQAKVIVSENPRGGIWIDAPDINLSSDILNLPASHPLIAAISSLLYQQGNPTPPPFYVRIKSSIPVASGLGSGAAVSVALLRAVSLYLGHPLTDEQVNGLAFEVEKLHHSTPSGIDNTVITYNRPVYFVKGLPVETFHAGKPFTIVIGDTGVSAPTRESVERVRKLWESEPSKYEEIFDRIGEIARQARLSIEQGKGSDLGRLMDANHVLLQMLTVSSSKLDKLVNAARQAGALGAKLSGGGRGGNMIALVSKENAPAVAEALGFAGAKRTTITQVK